MLASFFDLGGFEHHPDKTQTHRLENGFDWLGVWFVTNGASIALRAIKNHCERRVRLYEQFRRRGYDKSAIYHRMQA